MTQEFKDFGLLPQLEENLAELNYVTPTPIQAQAIPILLEGKDLLGIAQTGTGKTAAFSLPLLHNLASQSHKVRPYKTRALIMAPTRELASQIQKDIKVYAQGLGLKIAVMFGGTKQHNQVRAMKQGPDILVATPGRLEDLIGQGFVKLDHLDCVILDEADRMLDMGFIAPIRRIMALAPKDRQTLLFSATMPNGVKKLTQDFMNNPIQVEVSPESSTVDRIDQQLVHIPQTEKLTLLKDILQGQEVEQVIVFSRTKHGAERLCKGIKRMEINSAAIHGNKTQSQRQKALEAFKQGEVRVLVATDVAARGIDVAGVTHVINYDLPEEPESYVHRIGRTGRAGRSGVAISFCSGQESKQLKAIERTIGARIPLSKLSQDHWTAAAAAEPPAPKRVQGRRPQNPSQMGGSVSRPSRAPRGRGGVKRTA